MVFIMRKYLELFFLWSSLLVAVNAACSSNQECILINNCPHLYNLLLQDKLSEQDVQILQKSQCGFDKKANKPTVCCQRKPDAVPADTSLLPGTDVCGQDPSKRIVGGQLTELRQFPWLVLLEYDKPTGRGFHCGGSLINKNYVLTAAHCIVNIPRSWRLVSVRLGEHQLDADPDCEDGDRPGFEDCADSPIDIPVSEVTLHQQYARREIAKPNDIALVRLSTPVTYSKSISPICLPTKPEFLNNRFNGAVMTVAGWGRTENSTQSNTKLKLDVPITQDAECRQIYERNGATLTDKQICAGGRKGQDSCSGDSGGPLMYLERQPDYIWYLFGIVSFGPTRCGTAAFPGIYTFVPKYLSWIVENMKS
uniref:CLIP domain-containing serine protease n=1 Tax=Photinus pyralis TaxID=7054 RepID=A0A1Y1LL33_PHOPY